MKHNLFFRSRSQKAMSKIWDFLTSKTGGFIIGISAILIGSYQFYINRPILRYSSTTSNLVSSQNDVNPKLKVNDQEFSDLYVTKIILNNDGALALSGADVSKIGHDPIRIHVPKGAKVVHYSVDNLLTSEAVSSNVQTLDNGDILIKFDFLNPDNMIGITLLHENADEEFYVTGSAVNVNRITKEW